MDLQKRIQYFSVWHGFALRWNVNGRHRVPQPIHIHCKVIKNQLNLCTIIRIKYCNNIIRIIEINFYFRRYIGMVLAIAGILMAAGATVCGLQIYVRIYSKYNGTFLSVNIMRNRLLFIANMVLTLISAFWRCNWC